MLRSLALLSALTLCSPGVLAQAPASAPATAPASQPSPPLPPALEALGRHIPDRTHLLVIVPEVRALAAGIAQFGKVIESEKLAGTDARELLDDPLGAAAEAVDPNSPVVLAVSAGAFEPLILARLADGWESKSAPEELADGVRLYDVSDCGHLVVLPGRVVAFAREKADVRRALQAGGGAGQRLLETAAAVLPRNQLVVAIDAPAWEDQVQRYLMVLSQGAYMGMAAAGPDAEAALQIWKWLFEQIERLVGEVQTCTAGVRIGESGVAVETRLHLKPDGMAAGYLKDVRRPRRDPLRGLPAHPAAIVFAGEWELPPGRESIDQAMAKAIMNVESLQQRFGEEKFRAAMKHSLDAYGHLTGYGGLITQVSGGKGMIIVGTYLTENPSAVHENMRAVFEACPEMMSTWGGMPSMRVRHERETIGGVPTEAFYFQVDSGAQVGLMDVEALYGTDPVMLLASHQPGVVYVLGPQEEARKLLERMFDRDQAPLTREPRVRALLERFTPEPQFFVLLDLPRMFDFLGTFARQAGAPFPSSKMSDQTTPLAGMSFYLEPAAVRMELFVHSESIRVMIRAFEELQGGDEY